MSKIDNEHDDDFALFKEAVQGVKKLQQDTISSNQKKILSKKKSNAQIEKQVTLNFTSQMSLFLY